MFSSSGDVVCTLIIEILDIFNERLGWGGGGERREHLFVGGVRLRLVERGAS